MKEAYCSYEVAKLLKDKGFDIHCDKGWDTNIYDVKQSRNFSIHFDDKKTWIPDPTHQMALAWLRDKKGIFISIEPYVDDPHIVWSIYIKDYDLNWVKKKHDENDSYEEAVEAALKYSLENLI